MSRPARKVQFSSLAAACFASVAHFSARLISVRRLPYDFFTASVSLTGNFVFMQTSLSHRYSRMYQIVSIVSPPWSKTPPLPSRQETRACAYRVIFFALQKVLITFSFRPRSCAGTPAHDPTRKSANCIFIPVFFVHFYTSLSDIFA